MTRRTCPYLDSRPPQDGERTLIAEAPWLSAGLGEKIIRHAIASIVPPDVEEVRARRLPQIGKLESEISAPLRKEINYWDHRAEELKSQERAGRHTRLPPAQAAARATADKALVLVRPFNNLYVLIARAHCWASIVSLPTSKSNRPRYFRMYKVPMAATPGQSTEWDYSGGEQ